MSTSAAAPTSSPNVGPEDNQTAELLARFREEWKQEVRQRKEQVENTENAPPPQASSSKAPETDDSARPQPTSPEPKRAYIRPGQPSATHSAAYTSQSASHLTSAQIRAIEVYRNAVRHEQQSNLDEALRLYRNAFRLDSNVDKLFHREQQRLQALANGATPSSATRPTHKKATSSTGNAAAADAKDIAAAVEALAITEPGVNAAALDGIHASGALAELVSTFPAELLFEPEDEREGVPIGLLPNELLLHILRTLDHTTIERFASVNRKARVLALDPSIWREFVQAIYKPPQISDSETLLQRVAHFRADYRRVYMEQPRVRMDGVYIAVCHYVRRGLSEQPWVNIDHLITYHRYLRFFPDGTVLSLLANEEMQPATVIPMLKPALRMKGFCIGEWTLDGTTVFISNLVEMKDRAPLANTTNTTPSYHHHHHQPPPQEPSKYQFQMELELRSRPLGRWNRLDLVAYDTVQVATGEVLALPLKHDRPFWFSRVRSWPAW
ncbi:hypothetical protein CONPUDRAFT_127505 [Coniophora puteana RWD-64-598 SS2]|uniref:F-box only protein 9 n=1 Tax=Coniophora puteana (strain RWD-64-598) TaxID=741705 RepID=A0A5M3MK54_CONPW|nr:uncharacterized protein CONPUDRAFT_127505 [Coniophora puteana RWD-64-598 SS2]EIW79397.1 hypothetical protein CONPUDRAFT_127505 [Coniophora puteana RWD-64-598 SS2]